MLVTLLLGILPQIGLKFVYPAVSVIVSLLV